MVPLHSVKLLQMVMRKMPVDSWNKAFLSIQLLIGYGAVINALRHDGSALGLAAEKGNEGVVNLLLSRRALVDGNEGPSWLTPLQASCGKIHFGIAKALLDAGANVNALDEPRLSP
ncbi:hypothetical protein E4T43_04181 [Aureobasidium subglaciale]|nr:hypothetical protein E4T43_04181 [Aureobasidium subglaciale]